MTKLETSIERVATWWALFGGLLLLLIVIVTAINAAGFTLDAIAGLWGGDVSGLPGYEDAVTLLVGVAALSMFPYCQFHKGHAIVDVFMQNAPLALNRLIGFISAALTVLLALFLAYMLVQGVIQMRSDNIETTVLGWPVWIFASTSIFSCILWAATALVQLWPEKAA